MKQIFFTVLILAAVASGINGDDVVDVLTSRHRRDTLDPHGEFCVDVSTYGPVIFNQTTQKKCDSTFTKTCEDKDERVCGDVTEIQCDIVPYTECEMRMQSTPYQSFKEIPQKYRIHDCNLTTNFTYHHKMVPECKNITRQNCVTKWETDENGQQVWAGNEDCEPVVWKECKLVPQLVKFKVPKTECFETENEIEYNDWVPDTKTQMTTSMTCKVKYTSNCRPFTSNKCTVIRYQECHEEPTEECIQKEKKVPWQKREHKKKCLLPENYGADFDSDFVAQGSQQTLVTVAAPPRQNIEPRQARAQRQSGSGRKA